MGKRQTGKMVSETTTQKTHVKQYVSPLTANVVDASTSSEKVSRKEGKNSNKVSSGKTLTSKRSQKRARMEAKEALEEQRLTAMLFGGDDGGGASAFQDLADDSDDDDENTNVGKNMAKLSSSSGKEDEESGAFAFEIDRVGDDDDDDDDDDDKVDKTSSWIVPAGKVKKSEDDDDDDDNSVSDDDNESAPAWVDDDDRKMSVNIVDSSSRLKKLRKHRDETAAKALDGQEFERRLRQRFEETTQLTARTDWARLEDDRQRKPNKSIQGREDDDEEYDYGAHEDAAALLGSTSAPLLATSQHRLPPNILKVIRCPDANQSDPNLAVVQAVHFHPGSDPEKPLLLTAGLDKTLRFFQVGAEKSEKIHGIHFPKMPIYSASFLGDSGNVVVSGRRSFFYMYDAVAGKVDLVPRIIGRSERSWERHVASPDGKIIAFMGHDGYIVLVDAHSKHWMTDLKMNGSVRAVTFTPDSSQVIASGSDGDVYRWDLRSRRCVERFSNNDGTITSALAASQHQLAVGAESGVVNLYSEHSSSGGGGYKNSLLLNNQRKEPLKSIMNLHTSAECLQYNHDGQILAMSTRREKHGMKLLHVPSRTVFSNWPTSKTPLNYIWSMDFSPQSQFLAMGNDKGKCLLYRLLHYEQEG